MRRSFSFRLAAAFAGVGIAAAALTAILVNSAFGGRFAGYLTEQRDVRQRQLVAALADSYRRMKGWNDEDLNRLAPLALMDGGTLRLENPAGATIWTASEDALGEHFAAMHRDMMGSGPLAPERRLPVAVDDAVGGVAVARLPEPGVLPADVSFRSAVNRLLLAGGIGAGVVALVVGLFLARRATAPVRALTDAARGVASGDRSQRVSFDGTDEFGEMAQTFNLMADTIEEEDRLRRAFAADVAHELRTPLAILRSEIEALQDGVAKVTPGALGSLHEETLRLSRLVADLETLARADAAGFSLERRIVDLADVVAGAVREYRGPLEAGGITVETNFGEVGVEADAARLQQVVGNLLSNALKFTPQGGRVTVSTAVEGPSAELRISDTGQGIPPEELPHVFDRFFRGRGARAAGSGVGLTVVRELVRAHGGDVHVASEPGQGTTFTVRLPKASSSRRSTHIASSSSGATVGTGERRP